MEGFRSWSAISEQWYEEIAAAGVDFGSWLGWRYSRNASRREATRIAPLSGVERSVSERNPGLASRSEVPAPEGAGRNAVYHIFVLL